MGKLERKDIDRFWSKVNIKSEDECWEWGAGKSGDGYGGFKLKGKQQKAHRVAWIIEKGEIPSKLVICHKCDNKQCCNTKHLFLGTLKDNYNDMISKRRHSRKLNDQTVLNIINEYNTGKFTNQGLADKYGISQPTIHGIINRKYYKYLDLKISKIDHRLKNATSN